jgi:hypothetical protein
LASPSYRNAGRHTGHAAPPSPTTHDHLDVGPVGPKRRQQKGRSGFFRRSTSGGGGSRVVGVPPTPPRGGHGGLAPHFAIFLRAIEKKI